MRGIGEKVVIVTGGAGGIGSAVCRRLAEEGARVAIFDLNGEAANRLAVEIASAGGQAHAEAVDISDYEAVRAAVRSVEGHLGPIDVLINNAGWDVFKPFAQSQPDEWHQMIAVNLVGPLNMHHVVLPGMMERGHGRIVNVSSDAGRVGSSGEAVYAACKAGLIGLSKTLAREHARHGVTVNVVCPGPTDTALFAQVRDAAPNPDKLEAAFTRAIPLGRIAVPEDLAGAICFFASDDAGYSLARYSACRAG